MDGFRARQDGSMRVSEKPLDETPCWHSVFSPGIAVLLQSLMTLVLSGVKIQFN